MSEEVSPLLILVLSGTIGLHPVLEENARKSE